MLPTPRRLTGEEKCVPWGKKHHDIITRRRKSRGASKQKQHIFIRFDSLLNYFCLYPLKRSMSNFGFLRYKAWVHVG